MLCLCVHALDQPLSMYLLYLVIKESSGIQTTRIQIKESREILLNKALFSLLCMHIFCTEEIVHNEWIPGRALEWSRIILGMLIILYILDRNMGRPNGMHLNCGHNVERRRARE